MTAWLPEQRRRIAEADDLHIAPIRSLAPVAPAEAPVSAVLGAVLLPGAGSPSVGATSRSTMLGTLILHIADPSRIYGNRSD